MSRIGQILIRGGLATENSVARALGVQHFAGGRLGTLLLERGSVDEDDLGKALAEQHGCDYIHWSLIAELPGATIAALPAKFAIRHAAIPYKRGEGFLRVVMRDPTDLRILDELFFVTGRKIMPAVAPEVRIYQALEKYYGERRTPRFAILAEKLSRPTGLSTMRLLPPPPAFFPDESLKPSAVPAPEEVWGEGGEMEPPEPPIIQSWKIPDADVSIGPWGVPPEDRPERPAEVESITWESAPPELWMEEGDVFEDAQKRGASSIWPESGAWAEAGRAEATSTPPEANRSLIVPGPSEIGPLPRSAESPVAAPLVPVSGAEPAAPAPLPWIVVPPPLRLGVEEAAPPALAPVLQAPASPAGRSEPPDQGRFEFPHVAAARGRDPIAAAALAEMAGRFPRTAIFVARAHAVTGWEAAGEGVNRELVRSVEIPWSEPSVFLNVKLSRAFYLGALPPLSRHAPLSEAMGGRAEECVVQPVMIKEKPVAFLYAEFAPDRGATPLDLAYLRELAGAAAAAFAASIRLKKKEVI